MSHPNYSTYDPEEKTTPPARTMVIMAAIFIGAVCCAATIGYATGASLTATAAPAQRIAMSVEDAEAASMADFGEVSVETIEAEQTMHQYGVRLAATKAAVPAQVAAGVSAAGWCAPNDWDSQGVLDHSQDPPTRVRMPNAPSVLPQYDLNSDGILSENECFVACDNTEGCTQAVYEQGGAWAEQCWLGGVIMSASPTARAFRGNCTGTQGCTDTCYMAANSPKGSMTDGWCEDWEHASVAKGGLGMIDDLGDTLTRAACFIACDRTPGCTQAVFETGGQFGNECWLGQAIMSNPVDRADRGSVTNAVSCAATASCSNTCYMSTQQPKGTTTAGWCEGWAHASVARGGLGMYGNDDTSEAECYLACDNTPGCTQAVFETGGQWNNECWLGTDPNPNPVDRADRGSVTNEDSCAATASCSDTCYSKGFQGTVTLGWCADWSHASITNGGLGMYGDDSTTEAQCYAQCDATPSCTQAIHETGGNFNNECWLGTEIMPNPLDRGGRGHCNRLATCHNYCYQSLNGPSGTVTSGWCAEWEHASVNNGGLGMIHTDNAANPEAACYLACDRTPGCTQAVFEEGGQWGYECWLGTAVLLSTPVDTHSRPSCEDDASCTDSCYMSVAGAP